MHHGDVHNDKVVVPWLVGQEDKRKQQRSQTWIEGNVSWATVDLWLVGGTKRRSDSGAAEMSMERGKGGSVFRREAARCPAPKEVDNFFFDQRISLAVVTFWRRGG